MFGRASLNAESENLLNETIKMLDEDFPTMQVADVDRWLESFYGHREHNQFRIDNPYPTQSKDDIEFVLKQQRKVNTFIDKLEQHRKTLEKLAKDAPTGFTAGTKLRIIRKEYIGECDVEVGMEGTVARLDAHPWPSPPAGKTTVRFDATLFDFIRDEDDEDTWWIHLHVPNYALEEIS